MTKRYKAIKISDEYFLTDSRGNPIICPVRNESCHIKCAWFSAEGRILRCKNTVIGALKGEAMHSFRLHSGPQVYDLDESLTEYELQDQPSTSR